MSKPLQTMISARAMLADRASVLGHPDDVLSASDLTVAEKRELLAAWASDAHAVRDAPALRQLDSGAVVSVDEVVGALRALDASNAEGKRASHPGRKRVRHRPFRHWRGSTRDDDDDPPPCPAAALPFGLELVRRRKWDGTPEPLAA